MADQAERFVAIFEQLRAILKEYEPQFKALQDEADQYILVAGPSPHNAKEPLHFGYLAIKKNYVSYHLIPIYMNPVLVEDMSPALKKRMQGKSCFNFTKPDEALFTELAHLTRRGFEFYQSQNLLP